MARRIVVSVYQMEGGGFKAILKSGMFRRREIVGDSLDSILAKLNREVKREFGG